MRLVSCSRCRSQYDVERRGPGAFLCHCGQRIDPSAAPAAERAAERCGSCGALLGPDATRCEYCGSELGVRQRGPICPECYARAPLGSRFCVGCGIAFEPQPAPDETEEWPCPCCGALMPGRLLAGVVLNECGGCGGLWVPAGHLDALVQHATAARRERELPPLRGQIPVANPAARPLAYRRCPVCEAFMLRRNYAQRSGIILDVCAAHGSWLDPDELEQIGAFILSGGLEQAQARERELRADQERRAHLAALQSATRAAMEGRPETLREPRGWVLELLRELLS